LESIYKIDTGSDHVVKFGGDRSRELGDYALNKKRKKNITSKIEDLPYYHNGRPNKRESYVSDVTVIKSFSSGEISP